MNVITHILYIHFYFFIVIIIPLFFRCSRIDLIDLDSLKSVSAPTFPMGQDVWTESVVASFGEVLTWVLNHLGHTMDVHKLQYR